MRWDSSRPVPWGRLMREWLIYTAVMAAVLAIFFRDDVITLLIGVLVSGPLYVLLGAVLAKFGYQRKTLAELRTPRASTTSTETTTVRARPAPTRRTSTGPNRPRPKR